MSTTINRTIDSTWRDYATAGAVTFAARQASNGIEWAVTADANSAPVAPAADHYGMPVANGEKEKFTLDTGERLWAKVQTGGSAVIVVKADAPVAGA